MTDTELIVAQAKMIAEQKSTIEYYRNRCDSLETELRIQNNTAESNDPLPLDAIGTANKAKMNV